MRTIKRYFSGEHTTTYSKATGLLPLRECGHRHRSYETASRCRDAAFPWIVYAELSDGTVITADTAYMEPNLELEPARA